MRDQVQIYLNGTPRTITGEAVFQPLSSYLRVDLQMTGTKVVCAEGDCGACTVLRAHPYDEDGKRFRALNSCILPVGLVDGSHLVTVEGLASEGELSEIQQRMATHHGGQCGFCTPGFVMALTAMFEKHAEVNERRAKNFLTGNLCRCTGYVPILEAALSVNPARVERISSRYGNPAVMQELRAALAKELDVRTPLRSFRAPLSLKGAAAWLESHPGGRIFSAATDLGVQCNKEKLEMGRVLSLNSVRELYEISESEAGFAIGAKVDLTRLQDFMESRVPEFARFLNVFASPQIKNGATLAGNIVNASPIADTVPFLLVLEAENELFSPQGARRVPLTDFYQDYKKMDMKPGEVLARVHLPKPKPGDFLRLYKVAQRKDLDISGVNAGFLASVKNGKVAGMRLALGGVGPTALRLAKTEAYLAGKTLTTEVVREAQAKLRSEIAPRADVRGSAEYRLRLAENLFGRFCEELSAAGKGGA